MTIIVTANELMDKGAWDNFCEARGLNVWAVNEGLMDSNEQFTLTTEEVKQYGFIKE